MSAMRLVGKVLLGLLVLAVAGYALINVFGLVGARLALDDARDEATARLPEVRRELDADATELTQAAGREPDATWVEQVCERGHSDSGWMVNDWNESCQLRAVHAWQVDTAAEASALAASLGVDDRTGCPYVVPWEKRGASVSTPDLGCGPDWGSADTQLVDGSRADLSAGVWLSVADQRELTSPSLGCLHWSVLFCDDPGGGHPWAETLDE